MGAVQGTFAYALGADTATIAAVLYEIERSANGITGRIRGASGDAGGCTYDGRFGAVRR